MTNPKHLTEAQAAIEADRLIREAYRQEQTDVRPAPTSYRDDAPVPAYGTTPPVIQPGRPPMSQRATDISGVMLAGGVASLPVGGMTALILWVVGQANTTNLIIGGAAPTTLVLAGALLVRSLGRAKKDMHTEIHQHYTGTVVQRTEITSTARGMLSRSQAGR